MIELSPSARGAVESEVARLRAVRLSAWLLAALMLTVLGLGMMGAGATSRGLVCVLLGGVLAIGFAIVRHRQRAGRVPGLLFVDAVEHFTPWVFFLAVGVTSGADAMHAAIGPPMLFCGALVIGMLALRPIGILLQGVDGVVLYLAATAIVGPGSTTTALDIGVRAALFAAAAAVVAWVTHGLRAAMGGAVRTSRARDLFGKYRLEREIASGGMGAVWLATYCPEGGFQRPAAVKMMLGSLATDAAFVDAFRQEAELGARLVHPHVVQTFDFGVVDGRVFLAMEYVDGPTLRELMQGATRRGLRIPPPVAGAIARGILSGLAFAHSGARDADGTLLRVIHRDLAPSNVLITRSGTVKVTDFGIARALRGRDSSHTETVAGHLDYMSPEQAQAAPPRHPQRSLRRRRPALGDADRSHPDAPRQPRRHPDGRGLRRAPGPLKHRPRPVVVGCAARDGTRDRCRGPLLDRRRDGRSHRADRR
jgi:serine/threonine-protein kinase